MTPVLLSILLFTGFWFVMQHWRRSDRAHLPAVGSGFNLHAPHLYPIEQAVPAHYQPIGTWVGRLILPPQVEPSFSDRVWFEIYHAPAEYIQWVGQTVELTWQETPEIRQYVQSVTQNVQFTAVTAKSQRAGAVHPDRLNGLKQVGPLVSLAGARDTNDMMVRLPEPVFVDGSAANSDMAIALQINQEPVQISGRIYGLVTFLGRVDENSDRFRVRHFNPISQQFDGAEETVLLLQLDPIAQGFPRLTSQGIEFSPLNAQGWYLYGAKNTDGIFVVQAIAPYACLRLQPDDIITGKSASLEYLHFQNWHNTPAHKGNAWTQLLDPQAQTSDEALGKWQEGDRGIVMHLFGGIGGRWAEPKTLGTISGHFAYGIANVVHDDWTNELRFDIEYYQVYAHNPHGIISGTIDGPSYLGDLQRGWLGTRPISDVIVKFNPITEDYQFGDFVLSPLTEFTRQLQLMTARYRIGDGTGAAIVTPAASCVQDSNQALYIAIQRIEQQVDNSPEIQNWFAAHPHHPQRQRFQQLGQLGRSLEQFLSPFKRVRADWRQNAETPSGIRPPASSWNTIAASLTTWQTVFPRRAHDQICRILLEQGAALWLIRTNQLGGHNPDILPLAPTVLMGRVSQ
jgi:predicted Abi (CAAX) family protease